MACLASDRATAHDRVVHLIADDLGIPRDYVYSTLVEPATLKTWWDRAEVVLELEIDARLMAEWLMDEADASRQRVE